MAIQKNFNVVGSTVITDEGIASNFSTTNYLTLSGIDTSISDTSWTLQIGLTTPTSETSNYQFFLGNRNSYYGVVFKLFKNKLTAYLGTGSSWDISSGTIESTENLSLGTFYYISLSYTGTSYSLKYSTNKSNWIEVFNIETNSKVILKDLLVGTCFDLSDGQIFKGSVNLKELKITSNGKEVWNAWKDIGVISGSVTVDKGYYNVDGTNIIKFTSPIKKTLTEAKATLNCGNKIILTLNNANQSDFIVNGVMSNDPSGYNKIKKLDTPLIITDPTKQYILGTEPTGIKYQVTPQKPGGYYELKYLTLNGSVSYNKTTGKLSGFSESNYATSSSGIAFGNSFDLIFNVTVDSSSTQQTLFYGKDDRGLLFTLGKIAAWFGGNVFGVTSVTNGNTYWIRLVWSGTLYTAYSLLDDGTYTLATLPEISSWTQEFTKSNSTNIFASGYWIGYHSQATYQYARSTFNMGKTQITTGGVTYRYADGDAYAGSVSFTKGWDYESSLNKSYQIKSNQTIPLSELIANTNNLETVGYENSVGLVYESNSDESTPIVFKTSQREPLIIVPDIYIDNTKTKLLGTTSTSESWKDIKDAVKVSSEYAGGGNYTIIGSDAKVTDGIASGFTNTSGLTIPNNPFVNADINSIKILFEVTTGSGTTPYQEVLAQNNCILVRRGSGASWSLAVYTGSRWLDYSFGNFELNTKYYIRILYFKSETTFEGFTYDGGYTHMEVSKDNAAWARQSVNQKPLFDSGKPMYIGYNGSAEAWSGSIDLNNTKFYLNDTLVWPLNPSPGSVKINKGYKYIDETDGSFFIESDTTKTLTEAAADLGYKNDIVLTLNSGGNSSFVLNGSDKTLTGYKKTHKLDSPSVYVDPTKQSILGTTAASDSWNIVPNYSIIGSPTISSDGDATNFSDSNYLTTLSVLNPNNYNSFEIVTSFTPTNTSIDNAGIIDSAGGSTNIRLAINFNGLLYLRVSKTGDRTYIVDLTGTTTLATGTTYWAKVSYDSTNGYVLESSTDGKHWNVEASSTVTTKPYYTVGLTQFIGDNSTSGSAFEGTLHLKDWYITLDNKIVWKYMKNPYYITKGTSSTNAGSICFVSGYRYIDETNGSFFIRKNTTKTLDELVVGDKVEQMGLYLVIKEDKSTDFVLSATEPTSGISYSEKVVDVYLDNTLSYIMG